MITRRSFVVSTLLAAAILGWPLCALGEEYRFDFSILLEPGGSYSSISGVDLDAGFGLGLGWTFGERWGLDARVIAHDGNVVDTTTRQLGLRRWIGPPRRWRPYLVFGASRESTDVDCGRRGACFGFPGSTADVGVFAGGGVDWGFRDWGAIRFDGRFVAYDADFLEDELDMTVGFVLRR